MPTITIHANQSGGSSRETLSERVVAAHLRDEHYSAQLIERLTWATIDAEGFEPASNRADTNDSNGVASETNADAGRLSAEERARSYARPSVSYLGPQA